MALQRTFPFMGVSAAEAHDVLKRAWWAHWIVRHCPDDMIQRATIHHGKSLDIVKLPVFPSWVEEQRILRAVWRLQVCMMLEFTDKFRPSKVKFDILPSFQLWKHLSWFEVLEFSLVKAYTRRHLEQPNGVRPRDWTERLEDSLFEEEMTQSSWPVLNLVESAENCFSDREESHLRMPGRGCKMFSLKEEPNSGRRIWDKDRLRRLGLDVCACNCRL